MALDPGHVTLLVIVATPIRKVSDAIEFSDKPSAVFDNPAARAELEERWHAADDLLDQALTTLEGAGLIQSVRNIFRELKWWVLRPYGRRFFDFLKGVDEAPQDAPESSPGS